jgi:hypothetical protein
MQGVFISLTCARLFSFHASSWRKQRNQWPSLDQEMYERLKSYVINYPKFLTLTFNFFLYDTNKFRLLFLHNYLDNFKKAT